jgi:hypothetical protein
VAHQAGVVEGNRREARIRRPQALGGLGEQLGCLVGARFTVSGDGGIEQRHAVGLRPRRGLPGVGGLRSRREHGDDQQEAAAIGARVESVAHGIAAGWRRRQAHEEAPDASLARSTRRRLEVYGETVERSVAAASVRMRRQPTARSAEHDAAEERLTPLVGIGRGASDRLAPRREPLRLPIA